MDVINGNVQIEQRPDIKINTAEADLIEIIIVRLGGENQDQKGLVDFLLYRKDRLWRSLELKNARTEAGTTTRRFLD